MEEWDEQVTDLVNCSGSRLEALESSDAWFVNFVIDFQNLRVRASRSGCLPVDQVHGKPFGVRQCQQIATSWGILDFLDVTGSR